MADTEIDFTAPATLVKWPSLNKQRVPQNEDSVAYVIVYGTLDECIREFIARPQPHLYEIHTKAQPPLIPEVLQVEHVVELARLREFL